MKIQDTSEGQQLIPIDRKRLNSEGGWVEEASLEKQLRINTLFG